MANHPNRSQSRDSALARERALIAKSRWTFDADGRPTGLALDVFRAVDDARLGDQAAWRTVREAYVGCDATINEAAMIREAYWRRVDAA